MGSGASREAPRTQANVEANPLPTVEYEDIDVDDLPLPLNHIVNKIFS